MRARRSVITLVVVLGAAVPVGAAARTSRRPLTVERSSLIQLARSLKWSVRLTSPFSPAGLHRAGRSLCLLLERRRGAGVFGRLCVIGPRPGRKSARIAYQRVARDGPGPAHAIAATVKRGGPRQLTAVFLPAEIGTSYRSLHWQVINTLKPPACIPVSPNRAGCVSLFPAQPALAELHVPQLVGCMPVGAAYVTNGPRNRHEIALTFDDGPWNQTSQFLDVLERYRVQATFFEIGDQVSTYGAGGAVERRMLADGDMIGDHTWNHANLSGAGSFAAGEISAAAGAIRQATHGFTPCLLRAPYGATSGALIAEARSMGFTTIEWDVDPRDWSRPGTQSIYNVVTSTTQNGSIILQHDGGGDRSQTLAALEQEIQTFKRRGYTFVTVTQMLGQRLIYR